MSLRNAFPLLAALWAVALSGCATGGLLKKDDYTATRQQISANSLNQALNDFPQKESGGLITTTEKTYLGLLSGRPAPKPLMHIADHLAEREIIFVSRELKYFFYQESEEGYFPAEHEVVWMHILTGLSFAAQNNREDARVEAVRAAHFLQGHFSEKTGDFDDPGLRSLLAGLFLYCGEWEHARVDLRRAGELSSDFKWAAKLAERDRPPRQLFLALVGSGPEPAWQPDTTSQYVTGKQSLRFVSSFTSTQVDLTDAAETSVVSLKYPYDTKDWYLRHQDRNSEIRDVLQSSKYMAKAGGVSAATGSGIILSKVVTGTLIIGAIAVAAAVVGGAIYLGAQAGSGSGDAVAYIAGLGIASGQAIANGALKFDRENMVDLKKYWRSNMDFSSTYRFVRFLPDRIFASGTATAVLTEPRLKKANGGLVPPFLDLRSPNGDSQVSFFFLPN